MRILGSDPIAPLLLAALLACPPAFAESVPASGLLSLDGAVKEGESRSPKVLKAEAAFEASAWKKTETLSGFLPSINLSANHFFAEKYQFLDINFGGNPATIPQIFPFTSATLDARLPLFDGLQNVRRYSAANLQKDASENDLTWTRFQVEQEVRLRFLQALAAERLERVSEQNLTTIQDHLNQTQNLRKGGVATNFDVLRVEVQLNEAKSEVLQAQDNVYLARQRLANSMGLPGDDRPLQGELPTPDASIVESVQKPTTPLRADLIAQERRTQAASDFESSRAAYWVPKLSLGAQYIEYNNLTRSMTDSSRFRSAYSVGVFLNWNLFDGMTSIALARQAFYERVQAENSLEQSRLQLPYDLNFWKRRYVYSSTLYRAKRSDIEKAQESVRLATEGFRAGARTSTEVLDAELDLFRARAGVVNAQTSSLEALINLELALGRRI